MIAYNDSTCELVRARQIFELPKRAVSTVGIAAQTDDRQVRDAGGSRTHFDRVAAGCRAVWLQRHCARSLKRAKFVNRL